MSSIACQKDYTMVVGAGGGPPHGPVQLDAASVAEINRGAKELGAAGNFTGLLSWNGTAWIEPQSDAPMSGAISISPFRSPGFIAQLIAIVGGAPFPSDTYFVASDSLAGTFPVGTWTKTVAFPVVYFDGIPIVVSWA